MAVAVASTVTGAGCAERDRITFAEPPGAGTGEGPTINVDRPLAEDTAVAAGPDFFVQGTMTDPDGIDSAYFDVEGSTQIPPVAAEGDPLVRFGLPLTTGGLAGRLVTVRIHGLDVLGNRSDTVVRRIEIR